MFDNSQTWPDYYIENETYLPYRWDASDISELIEKVVSKDALLEQIARNGQKRFRSFNVHKVLIVRNRLYY